MVERRPRRGRDDHRRLVRRARTARDAGPAGRRPAPTPTAPPAPHAAPHRDRRHRPRPPPHRRGPPTPGPLPRTDRPSSRRAPFRAPPPSAAARSPRRPGVSPIRRRRADATSPRPRPAPTADPFLGTRPPSARLRRDRSPRAAPRPASPPRAEPAAPPTDLARVARALDEGRKLAERHDRPDLGSHLEQARKRLGEQVLSVAVVGEFKRGKSTLVNALLQTDVCPIDADIVTAVPTVVRYGAEPSAAAPSSRWTGRAADSRRPAPSRSPSTWTGSPTSSPRPRTRAGGARLRSVEVRLPHRLLKTGLSLVDTPGVGGLESAHGIVTLGALRATAGVIFVTDASQELTGPEVDFLAPGAGALPRRGLRRDQDRPVPGVAPDRRAGPAAPGQGRHRPADDPRVVVPAAARVALPRTERGVGVRAAVRLAARRGAGGRGQAGRRRRVP